MPFPVAQGNALIVAPSFGSLLVLELLPAVRRRLVEAVAPGGLVLVDDGFGFSERADKALVLGCRARQLAPGMMGERADIGEEPVRKAGLFSVLLQALFRLGDLEFQLIERWRVVLFKLALQLVPRFGFAFL